MLRFVRPVSAVLALFCLVGLWTLGPAGASAQVQIDQVEGTTAQIEGATQAQIFVAEDADGVNRPDVTALIPADAPGITDAAGNSASIFQRGDDNEVAIEQAGTGNEASAVQVGSNNAVSIVQGNGTLPSAFGGGFPGDLSAGEVFELIQTFSPPGTGRNNLAVAVHEGTGNRTSITQLGADNAAGIRLVGSGNTMNLLQTGSANRFLMDTAANDLGMTVVQNGSGNSLETNVPVNVQMNGNGIEMVVLRGTPLPADPGS